MTGRRISSGEETLTKGEGEEERKGRDVVESVKLFD
jgi:hypothetical protein